MDIFIIRNEMLSSQTESDKHLNSTLPLTPSILPFSQSILERFEEPLPLTSKKRKLIDRLVLTSSEKIKKTKSNYNGDYYTINENSSSCFYDSLSDSQILSYSNFIRSQFDLLYLELEPHLSTPHQKRR